MRPIALTTLISIKLQAAHSPKVEEKFRSSNIISRYDLKWTKWLQSICFKKTVILLSLAEIQQDHPGSQSAAFGFEGKREIDSRWEQRTHSFDTRTLPNDRFIRTTANRHQVKYIWANACILNSECWINFEYFSLKNAMRPFTAMNPSQRIERLLHFNKRLYGNRESMDTLSEWQLNLDKDLVEIKGRQIAQQKILIGNDQRWVAERLFVSLGEKHFWIQNNNFFLVASKHSERIGTENAAKQCTSQLRWNAGTSSTLNVWNRSHATWCSACNTWLSTCSSRSANRASMH